MKRRENIKLLGFSIPLSFVALSSLLSNCKPRFKPSFKQPQSFSKEQLKVLNKLVDIIIPTTDTPSATAVGVPDRIELLLWNNYKANMRSTFFKGLSWITQKCQDQYNNNPDDCTDDEVSQVLNLMISHNQTESQLDTYPFYPLLKGLTVSAFFTSKEMQLHFKLQEKSLKLH